MESRDPGLIRKTYRSATALFTAGCMISALSASATLGCNGSAPPPEPRNNIMDRYISGEGDQAYSVAAPAESHRHGLASYRVKTEGHNLKVTGVGSDQQPLGTIEVVPGPEGVRFTVTEGAATHVYVIAVSGGFATRDFQMRATIDGKVHSIGIDAQGRAVVTGDTGATPTVSPRMAQMWADMAPTQVLGGREVLTKDTYSRCAACWICGAAMGAFMAIITPILLFGWPAVSAAISGLIAGASESSIVAALVALGAKPGVAAAVVTGLIGLGGAVIHACYYCATGNPWFDTIDTGSGSGTGSDPGSGTGSDPGSGTGTGCDGDTCPVEDQTTPDLAGAWVFN